MFGCTPVWSVLPGLNSCDDQGNVPLHYAVEKNKPESCRALLDLGADPNILNTAFLAPLHLAVSLQYNDLVEVRMPGEKNKNIKMFNLLDQKSIFAQQTAAFPWNPSCLCKSRRLPGRTETPAGFRGLVGLG